MSKLSEYITLIPGALANTPSIIKAVTNEVMLKYDKLPEEEKKVIVERRLICNECPFNSVNAKTSVEFKSLTGHHYETAREDVHCSFCGCNTDTRTSGLDKPCGIQTWNANNPTRKLPLKWGKYEKTRINDKKS